MGPLVDRLMWSDDASHVLDRMPPYMGGPYKQEVEAYARSKGRRVVTWDLLAQVKQGGEVQWEEYKMFQKNAIENNFHKSF